MRIKKKNEENERKIKKMIEKWKTIAPIRD